MWDEINFAEFISSFSGQIIFRISFWWYSFRNIFLAFLRFFLLSRQQIILILTVYFKFYYHFSCNEQVCTRRTQKKKYFISFFVQNRIYRRLLNKMVDVRSSICCKYRIPVFFQYLPHYFTNVYSDFKCEIRTPILDSFEKFPSFSGSLINPLFGSPSLWSKSPG